MCCAEVIFKIMQENKTIITLKLLNTLFLLRMIRFFTGQRTISVWNHLVWISWICLFLFGRKHPFRWSVIELNWINCKMFQVRRLGRAQQEIRTSCIFLYIWVCRFFSLFFPAHCFLNARFVRRRCLLKELNDKNN